MKGHFIKHSDVLKRSFAFFPSPAHYQEAIIEYGALCFITIIHRGAMMNTGRIPNLFKAAVTSLVVSFVLGGLSIIQATPESRQMLLYLALGSLFCGIGEIVNHPRQVDANYTDNSASNLRRVLHRARNPCLLGNILAITGIIFLFMGFSPLIFP